MIPGYLIFAVFFVLLYIATYENRQLVATTSAIREIWTRNCRLSCRRSDCSGLSGLHERAAPSAAAAAAPRDCICEFCPCAAIESVFRSCQPATVAYNSTMEALAEGFYNITKVFAELYLLVRSTVECAFSCQRPTQLINVNSFDTDENFNFDAAQPSERDKAKQNEESIDKIKKKMTLETKKSLTSIKSAKGSKIDISKEEETDKVKLSKKKSLDLKRQKSPGSIGSSRATSSNSNCPRCVEKGKLCIGTCPRANVNHKKS